ncbi:MAG: Ig-like domain-containing protein [Chloroflexi bacterium]|nr:Ig-like domain-containing protein [Chloroflexota bacterium]
MRSLRLVSQIWAGVLLAVTFTAFAALIMWRIVLPAINPTPRIVASDPAADAGDVGPTARITLRFDQPMNRYATARALRLDPPVPFAVAWDASATRLQIMPAAPLAPATRYSISVGAGAVSRGFAALGQPWHLSFTTAPAPVVRFSAPADGTQRVALDSPIVLRFSRAIVAHEELYRETTLRELRLEPASSGRAMWITPDTVVFYPTFPLRAGTRYRATLAAGLRDVNGSALRDQRTWQFVTAMPEVRDLMPADGARLVPRDTPIAFTLSSPLPRERITAGFALSPPLRGTLEARTLADGSQRVQFMPAEPWRANTDYTVTLALDPNPNDGLTVASGATWQFSAAPLPGLVARFPGEGQALPPGQELRLVFSTPVDPQALARQLRFSPAVADVDVRGAIDVRLSATLTAATNYTLTIPADATDLAGVPFGRDITVAFRTAALTPALDLAPETPALIAGSPGLPLAVALEHTNISQIALELYRLDESAVLRVINMRRVDWSTFDPSRYGQVLLRRWTLPLAAPGDQPTRTDVAITGADGSPLAPGHYFVRVTTPEGPRVDALAQLTMLRGVLVGGTPTCVTALAGDEPAAAAVVTLFGGDTALARGTTDERGLWCTTLPAAGSAQLLSALIDDGDQRVLALARTSSIEPPTVRLALVSDRSTVTPGASLQVFGVATGATAAAPTGDVTLALLPESGGPVVSDVLVPLDADGTFQGTLTMPPWRDQVGWTVRASFAGATTSLPIEMHPLGPLDVTIGRDDASGALVTVREPAGGLPLATVPVSWTLEARPVAIADGVTQVHGIAPAGTRRSGRAVTDAAGQFVIAADVLADIDAALLLVRRDAADELPGVARLAAVVPLVTLVPPTSLARPGVLPVAVRARDAAGQPLGQRDVRIEVLRVRTGAGVPPREQRVQYLTLRTDGSGTSVVNARLDGAGEYRIRATVRGTPRVSEITIIALADDPPPLADVPPTLVGAQPRALVGDVGRWLVRGPADVPLLARWRAGAPATLAARLVRSGDVITVPLTADLVPELALELHRVDAAADAPATTTHVTIRQADAGLALGLAAERDRYREDEIAQLALTTQLDGRDAPAKVWLAVEPLDGPLSDPPAGWQTIVATDATGRAMVPVRLAGMTGRLRVTALAVAPRYHQLARMIIAVEPGLRIAPLAPALVRVGDVADVGVVIANPTAAPREVSVTLALAGASVAAADPLGRTLVIPAGATVPLRWRATIDAAAAVAASITILEREGPVRNITDTITVAATAEPGGVPAGVALHRECRSGQGYAAAGRLSVAALLHCRLVIAVTEPISTLTVVDPLPGGATLLDVVAPADVTLRRGAAGTTITLGPAGGVVVVATTYRWDITGAFALPPPAVIIDGTARATGLPQTWIIEPAAP